MKIGIIGHSSDIGVYLRNSLFEQEHDVFLIGRSSSSQIMFDYQNQISEPLPDFDVLIFLAHDYTMDRNQVDSSSVWLESLLKIISPQKALFLSSRSVHPQNNSNYVFHKSSLETIFLNQGYQVLRVGLIVNSHGAYQNSRPVRNLQKILRMIPFSISLDETIFFDVSDATEIAFWIDSWIANELDPNPINYLSDNPIINFRQLCTQLGYSTKSISISIPVWFTTMTKTISHFQNKNLHFPNLDKIGNFISGMK